ncbi:GNAT family N-acetyltransferase [Nocardioides sp.]|uniref:GNAT family N-acetyltransferase n=1 Tax=Nocardioides sp. TaxID=35761 RepID=UPI0039E3C3BA
MADVVVRNDTDRHRYEAIVDGEVAGFATYRVEGEAIVFLHTEIDDRFAGQGIGSALARGALDDVRRNGELDVVPRCPFVKGWIEKHPDYQDLVHSR